MTPKTDSCCFLCKSPSGVCLTRFSCDHHREIRREQDAEDRRVGIGYSDPTGNAAVRNVMRERHRK